MSYAIIGVVGVLIIVVIALFNALNDKITKLQGGCNSFRNTLYSELPQHIGWVEDRIYDDMGLVDKTEKNRQMSLKNSRKVNLLYDYLKLEQVDCPQKTYLRKKK